MSVLGMTIDLHISNVLQILMMVYYVSLLREYQTPSTVSQKPESEPCRRPVVPLRKGRAPEIVVQVRMHSTVQRVHLVRAAVGDAAGREQAAAEP